MDADGSLTDNDTASNALIVWLEDGTGAVEQSTWLPASGQSADDLERCDDA